MSGVVLAKHKGIQDLIYTSTLGARRTLKLPETDKTELPAALHAWMEVPAMYAGR